MSDVWGLHQLNYSLTSGLPFLGIKISTIVALKFALVSTFKEMRFLKIDLNIRELFGLHLDLT